MAQNFRHDEILNMARTLGKVSVDGLADHFQVTAQTIRRDLAELCDVGHLTRVHGGAIPPSSVLNPDYEERSHLAVDEKQAMARQCAAQIPDGVSIFLNIGTTTEAVARALLNHKNLMVITNNFNVAKILSTSTQVEVIVTGGILRRSDGGLVGDVATEIIRQFRADYAVIGIASIAEDGTLLDHDFREVRVTQAIIQNSRKTFLVADAIKFDRRAPVRICDLADIDAFFTDAKPPDLITEICAHNEVDVFIAN